MAPIESPENMASVTDFKRLEGVWRSRGYGKILWITEDHYTFFEETSISCLPVHSGCLEELTERYVDLEVSQSGRTFSARRATGVTRVGFSKLKALPRTVAESEKQDSSDPIHNFEVFWQTFAEQYALFELKGLNWERIRQKHRSAVTSDTHPEHLFGVLAAMLRPLKDGHVRLHSPWGHYNAGAQPALYRRLGQELDAAGDPREIESYLGELREWLHEVIDEDYLQGGIRRCKRHLVEWGKLSDSAGYLNIRAMAGQSGQLGHPAEDIEAVEDLMPSILSELGTRPNLVLDLRGNGGGYDGVALSFASYLMDRKRVAFTKSARHGSGMTGQQSVQVVPAASGTYRGNLYVLTSELTSSAAEILVLALLQHPRLTLIGEPTHGILSDTLERHLPNGWNLTLSNEIYRAYDGQIYEDEGIPPHIRLPFLGRQGRNQGRDPMLERALNLMAANR